MNFAENPSNNRPAGGDWLESTKPPCRELTSKEIFAGERTVMIIHDGVSYRLQITRNNKLILQK